MVVFLKLQNKKALLFILDLEGYNLWLIFVGWKGDFHPHLSSPGAKWRLFSDDDDGDDGDDDDDEDDDGNSHDYDDDDDDENNNGETIMSKNNHEKHQGALKDSRWSNISWNGLAYASW